MSVLGLGGHSAKGPVANSSSSRTAKLARGQAQGLVGDDRNGGRADNMTVEAVAEKVKVRQGLAGQKVGGAVPSVAAWRVRTGVVSTFDLSVYSQPVAPVANRFRRLSCRFAQSRYLCPVAQHARSAMPSPPAVVPKASPVGGSAFARLAGLGGMAAAVGGRMVLGAMQQVASGQRPRLADLLLTPANAAKLTQQLAQMRGAALKVGQLMSMDRGDFLPPEFAAVLSRLRADADPMPPRQLRSVLDRSVGRGWISRFARCDVHPIASAAIGQVHRALTSDGRDLAIKLQYPGVRQSIASDVANLSGLLRLSGLVPRALDLALLLEQARAQVHEEADYLRKGAQIARFGTLLSGHPAFLIAQL